MIQTARVILTEDVAWRSLQLTWVALLLVVVGVVITHYPLALSHLSNLSRRRMVMFLWFRNSQWLLVWLTSEAAPCKVPKASSSSRSK